MHVSSEQIPILKSNSPKKVASNHNFSKMTNLFKDTLGHFKVQLSLIYKHSSLSHDLVKRPPHTPLSFQGGYYSLPSLARCTDYYLHIY